MGEWKKTQCNMCQVSCGLEMEVENNKIINVRPDKDSPKSKNYCCRKGRAVKYYQDNTERLDYPLKRVGDEFVRISWEQAYREIGAKAKGLLDQYGPRTFALAGCGLASTQGEAAVALTLLKAIGSQYYYNPFGIEFMGFWWSCGKIFGSQLSVPEPDESANDVLIFWGSNSYVAHNFNRSRQIIREFSEDPDRMVITVDPRLSETARMSDMHVALRPGTDTLLVRALIALIIREGWQDQKFIDERVLDFDQIKPWFEGFDIEGALEVCGIPFEQAMSLCKILATRNWGIHPDLGVFMGRHNTLSNYLLLILMVITGKALVKGGSVVANPFGHMGAHADEDDPKVWHTVETDKAPVLGSYPQAVLSTEMLSDNPEHLRVLFTSMTNPARSFPDSKAIEKGLDRLDLLVVIDIVMTETARHADYVLPGKTAYEAYDFNLFQVTFPETICQMKHPFIGQIGERKEDGEIWLGIAKAMGLLPPIPDSLYQAAEGDRVTYFTKLLLFVMKNRKCFDILPLIIAETLGKAMGSATRAMMWAILITSPMAGSDMVKRAGFTAGKKHRLLQLIPPLKNIIVMDNVFQAVDDHPEGVVMGISDNDKDNLRHLTHKDKKFHLYNGVINDHIRNITPDKEKSELDGEREYPFIISSGRHSEGGVNGVMRNPATYVHRKPYALAMNPEDAKDCGFEEGQEVRVTTKGGTLVAPVEISYQIARGYFFVPHYFGFEFNGKTIGEGVSTLARAIDIDQITGNPFLRYIPCKVEALEAVGK